LAAAALVAVAAPAVAPATVSRTSRDRVYTAEQATRGKQVYQRACAECHALDFYRGDTMKSWEGGSLSDLYDALSVLMPKGNPGSLKRREYVDILAYILSINGMPAGEKDLPSAAADLKVIRIKWGTRP
jgi:mono/diheme cytochrome c family protein